MRYLPYYCPWPEFRPEVQTLSWEQRDPIILSMPGDKDPSGRAMKSNFRTLSEKLPLSADKKWSFLMTWWAQWHENVPDVGKNIQLVRDCPEPWDLLCRVRAVAVITPFGYGFKTTILDGLAASCHVIVHPKLAKRLPPQIRQLCLVCDPSQDEDIQRLAGSLSIPPKSLNINLQLREMATEVLRSTFR